MEQSIQKKSGVAKFFKVLGIALAVLIAVFLLCRYVFFAAAFEKWDADLRRLGEWEENYKAEHPGATKEQIDAAFSQGIANLEKWRADYKAANPEATEEDIDEAWRKAWNQ
jgi:hypothetical protein